MSFTVNVHDHILPDFFFRETNDAHNPVGGIAPPPWDADLMLSYVDEAGIDVAVTSISTPGVHVGDDARANEGPSRRFGRAVLSFGAGDQRTVIHDRRPRRQTDQGCDLTT
jgi:hypothetical protein